MSRFKIQGSTTPAALAAIVSAAVLCLAMVPSQASAGPGSTRRAKLIKSGKALFTKNCVSCHGANAKGGEGPKLQGITASDARITKIIRNGKPGQMPAFAGSLKAAGVKSIIAYLRSIK